MGAQIVVTEPPFVGYALGQTGSTVTTISWATQKDSLYNGGFSPRTVTLPGDLAIAVFWGCEAVSPPAGWTFIAGGSVPAQTNSGGTMAWSIYATVVTAGTGWVFNKPTTIDTQGNLWVMAPAAGVGVGDIVAEYSYPTGTIVYTVPPTSGLQYGFSLLASQKTATTGRTLIPSSTQRNIDGYPHSDFGGTATAPAVRHDMSTFYRPGDPQPAGYAYTQVTTSGFSWLALAVGFTP